MPKTSKKDSATATAKARTRDKGKGVLKPVSAFFSSSSTAKPSPTVQGKQRKEDTRPSGSVGTRASTSTSARARGITSRTKSKTKSASASTTTRTASTSTRTASTSTRTASTSTSTSKSKSKPAPLSSKGKEVARVLSDEESEDSGEDGHRNEDDEGDEEEDPDRLLGLRPTLRVVSKATVRRTWKPVNVKTRTHVQTMVSRLFPAAISRARGEKRKIAVQITMNRMMQKMNDCLSELSVPPPGKDRPVYSQMPTRNKELEAMLVPDLEHIRDLELRIEQEQILADQDQLQLESFKGKKRTLDQHHNQLHRLKLHPLLRGPTSSSPSSSPSSSDHASENRTLPTKMIAALCADAEHRDYSHLSTADQRLMGLMPTSRDEDFSTAEIRDSLYNPDQDPRINKISKRLSNRLSKVERNGEGLDPLLQLVVAAQDRVRELSSATSTLSILSTSTLNSANDKDKDDDNGEGRKKSRYANAGMRNTTTKPVPWRRT